jgi:DnaJ homolog subfamily C member 3
VRFAHRKKILTKFIFRVFLYLLDGDPRNYLTFFKRATVYLALGKAKFALADLEKVLELKPDFTAVSHVLLCNLKQNSISLLCFQARIQMAQVLLKQGDLDNAEQVYYDVVRYNMKHS